MTKSVPLLRAYFSSLALGLSEARIQLRMLLVGACVFILAPWVAALDFPCENHDLCFAETWWPLVSIALTTAGFFCFLASLVGVLVAGFGRGVFIILGHQEQIPTLVRTGRLFNWFMMFVGFLGLAIWIASLL
jgi:hypothetical protein